MLPRAHAHWEATATIDDVRAIAVAADTLGYHHLTCSEHVAVPADVVAIRGGRYWDPLATFGFLAAHTERIRFATHVLVLGYHHPLAIAKRYGTLDQISDGRVILGVGVGSLEAEFNLLGAPFADRGARADDALRALRAALGEREPSYDGPHFQFRDFVVDPTAPRRSVPIWIGGRSARSLRRAVELGDGWAPFGLALDDIAAMLKHHAQQAAWHQRRDALEVWLPSPEPFDPITAPDATRDTVRALRAAGATGINIRFVHHSLAHYLEQLHSLVELNVD